MDLTRRPPGGRVGNLHVGGGDSTATCQQADKTIHKVPSYENIPESWESIITDSSECASDAENPTTPTKDDQVRTDVSPDVSLVVFPCTDSSFVNTTKTESQPSVTPVEQTKNCSSVVHSPDVVGNTPAVISNKDGTAETNTSLTLQIVDPSSPSGWDLDHVLSVGVGGTRSSSRTYTDSASATHVESALDGSERLSNAEPRNKCDSFSSGPAGIQLVSEEKTAVKDLHREVEGTDSFRTLDACSVTYCHNTDHATHTLPKQRNSTSLQNEQGSARFSGTSDQIFDPHIAQTAAVADQTRTGSRAGTVTAEQAQAPPEATSPPVQENDLNATPGICVHLYQSVQNVQINILQSAPDPCPDTAPDDLQKVSPWETSPSSDSCYTDLDYVSDDDNLPWEEPVVSVPRNKTVVRVGRHGDKPDSASDSDADEFFSLDSDSQEGKPCDDGSDVQSVVVVTENVQHQKKHLGDHNSSVDDKSSATKREHATTFDIIGAMSSSPPVSEHYVLEGPLCVTCSRMMDATLGCGSDDNKERTGGSTCVSVLSMDSQCLAVTAEEDIGTPTLKQNTAIPKTNKVVPQPKGKKELGVIVSVESKHHQYTSRSCQILESPKCGCKKGAIKKTKSGKTCHSVAGENTEKDLYESTDCTESVYFSEDFKGLHVEVEPSRKCFHVEPILEVTESHTHEDSELSDPKVRSVKQTGDVLCTSSSRHNKHNPSGVRHKQSAQPSAEALTGSGHRSARAVAHQSRTKNRSSLTTGRRDGRDPNQQMRPRFKYSRRASCSSSSSDDEIYRTSAKKTRTKSKCTVLVTDTDANITNTLDLDSMFDDIGRSSGALGTLPGHSGSSVVSCAGILDQSADCLPSELPCLPSYVSDYQASAGGAKGTGSTVFCHGSTDYVSQSNYDPSLSADDYDPGNLDSYPDNMMASNSNVYSESTIVYTDSTVAGIDTLTYTEAPIAMMGTSPYNGGLPCDFDSIYNSPDAERNIPYLTSSGAEAGTGGVGNSGGSVVLPSGAMHTCPHGYPAVSGSPVMVQAADMSLCSPTGAPDSSSILAGVYNTIAPLQCTLPPDCTLARTVPGYGIQDDSTATASAQPGCSSDAHSFMENTPEGADYSTDGATIHVSSESHNHIPLATIPNTTATIPAIMGNQTTMASSDPDTPASPTTSLQFRVQLKEFAFVGSCLKIAAKVSVTEEDADFWKHMHPGDVYFFSANSYVLCVQRNREKKQVTTPSKTTGLNPNANVFHIKSPTTPPPEGSTALEWPPTPQQEVDSLNNVLPTTNDSFAFMNGDTNKSPISSAGGGGGSTTFPPTPESPLSIGQADFSSINGALEGQVLFPAGAEGAHDENNPMDGNVPADQLRSLLKSQLEYYFSRENLANDSYLVSQMDADQYVSISTIAGFNQVKKLTNDLQLVIEVLRESAHVQVDEIGDKVRPLHKRCIVILREIPNTTPVKAVEKLFQGLNCPPFISCEFAHNDNWYVTFDSEEDAQKAYRYLREEVGTFLGRPIMARIKAKPLLRSSFVPKNGFKQTYETTGFPQQQKYQYPATVPSVPFIAGQQVGNTGYPFFPPNASTSTTVTPPGMPQVWPAGPAQLTFYDPGTAFAANGYTASATIKLPSCTSSRHGFQNMRNNRNQKPHRSSAASTREQGNSNQTERAERTSESDRTDQDQRERLGSSSREHATRDHTARDRPERWPYHERHQGGAGRGGHRSDSTISGGGGHHYPHHHNNSSAAPSSSRGQQHLHHGAHGGSGSSHAGAAQQHGHSHGPHGHQHSMNHHTAHSQSHSHSHSSLLSTERERDSQNSAALGSNSRHSSSSDISNKDQFSQSLPPRRGGSYRGRRRPRGHDENGANRSSSSSQSAKDKLSCDPPNFDLADTSFPPLPGSSNNTSSNDVFENKMSDVVKGTAKPSTRDVPKPSSVNSSSPGPTSTATGSLPSATATPTSPSKDVPTTGSTGPTPAPGPSAAAKPSPVAVVSTSTAGTNTATPTSPVSCPASLPTPQSPQNKSTSTETCSPVAGTTSSPSGPASNTALPRAAAPQAAAAPPASDSSSVSTQTSSAATTTTTATAATSTADGSSGTSTVATVSVQSAQVLDDGKSAKKLSYAEMAQRGKEKKGPQEKTQQDETSKDGAAPTGGATVGATGATACAKEATSSVSVTVSAVNTGAAANSASSRSPTRDGRRDDQPRDQRPFISRRPRDFVRRDDRKDRVGRDFDRENPRGGGGGGGNGFFRGDRDHRDRRNSARDNDRGRGK